MFSNLSMRLRAERTPLDSLLMRRTLACLCLALAGCGNDPLPPVRDTDQASTEPLRVPSPQRPAEPTEAEKEGSADAAEVLRDYYELIERGDFESAARLRSDEKTDAKRLADNFRAYEDYNVQVGRPSRPARSGEYLFVDVPVMITGSYKGGRTFGSGGRVTMRRPAESGGGGWRVYTG